MDKRKPNNDQYWYYIKEFNPTCFTEHSYLQNIWFCNICSIILDIGKDPSKLYIPVNKGPTYSGLVMYRTKIKQASAHYFIKAYQIQSYHEETFGANPIGNIMATITQRQVPRPRQPQPQNPEDNEILNIEV